MTYLVKETIQDVLDSGDPSRIKFNETMIPTALKVAGLQGVDEKRIVKELMKKAKGLTSRGKIEIAKELSDSGIIECFMIACDFLRSDKQLLIEATKADIKYFNKGLDNWASVDCYGVYVHGNAWRLGILDDEDIIELIRDKDYWQRRLGVVSTIPLNQKAHGGLGDSIRTLMICEMVKEDYHDMVVKAVSWALRELAKRESGIVKEFLLKHESVLHKRILREVRNKIFYGKKNL
ncbi:MAG: DNA alkylation repair protein [Prolixibacteraceae bacterium]|nr:DNA alkylation repair protein [Prolixibacteraceae bacterium]